MIGCAVSATDQEGNRRRRSERRGEVIVTWNRSNVGLFGRLAFRFFATLDFRQETFDALLFVVARVTRVRINGADLRIVGVC